MPWEILLGYFEIRFKPQNKFDPLTNELIKIWYLYVICGDFFLLSSKYFFRNSESRIWDVLSCWFARNFFTYFGFFYLFFALFGSFYLAVCSSFFQRLDIPGFWCGLDKRKGEESYSCKEVRDKREIEAYF